MIKSKAIENILWSFFIAGLCIYWGLVIHKTPLGDNLKIIFTIVVFIVFFIALFMFYSGLCRYLLPENEIFDELDFSNSNSRKVEELIGKKDFSKKNNITVISAMFFLVIPLLVYSFFKVEYDNEQFEANGIVKKIFIESSSRGKSSTYMHFKYLHNGVSYETKLQNKDFKIGDSANIIFSTHNPYIVKWQ